MGQTFHIETFGCQMNKNDSELMSHSLREHGFRMSDSPLTPILPSSTPARCGNMLKTGSFHESARYRKKIRERGGIIVVAGCMAQRIGEELIARRHRGHGHRTLPVAGHRQARSPSTWLTRSRRLFISQDESDFSVRINPGLSRPGEPRHGTGG